MDQVDNHNSTPDNHHILEMMKQHISNGLPYQYTTNCKKFNEISYRKISLY